MITTKLGKMLVGANLISDEQLNKALLNQQKEGGKLGSVLIKLGYIAEDKLLNFLSHQFSIPAINLSTQEIDPNVIKLLPAEVAQKYQVIPILRKGATITLAMVDPSDVFAIDDIKFMTGYDVQPVLATEGSIRATINKHYDTSDALQTVLKDIKLQDAIDEGDVDVIQEMDEKVDVGALKDAVEEAPVVKLVNFILADAVVKGVSDIHIEAYEKNFRVRYRLDGVLYEAMAPPMKLRAAMTSRLKIMADLDIAERRLPQDGRIKLRMKNKEIDLRVSSLPCLFGEKIVMRILDKSNLTLDLTKLGFEVKALQDFTNAINSPYGMVLVTGPTGSGKTTTLYSALNQINDIGVNIMTAEDPVEYNLMGVNQVQMKDEIGLNFAAALRSFLRQDPDIIMVGEIRDYETAEIAVKAALTGHLVLSTLHTNDAPSTINRLLNMGIEPFLVSSSVLLILAQRLIRKVCSQCKEVEKISPKSLIDVGFSPEEAEKVVCYKGKGCTTCSDTGYKGRIAIYEVMPIGEEIRELILEGASASEIKKTAAKIGMRTLRMSGLQKLKEGLTSAEEVLRVTFGD
ncbi:MAG: type IV-A pilus assembly ATPase PilB [Nitrospirae bacterium]|nr:type IV-A pilus assembly ATPase PilB [Nitrospirota bacterium]